MLKPVAVRLGLVDHPLSARKTHVDPTPLAGGAAITFAALIAGAILLPASRDLIALAAASLLLLVVGELDDRFDINWRIRITAQAAAGLVLYVWGGVRVESIGNALGLAGHTLGVLSLPFTVLATVGITNAVNWADGVDGLAGSLSLAALGMLVAASIYAGNAALATDLMQMAGCVMGFLAFNLRSPWRPRASVFLGCGAEILGLWVAWASFRLTQTPGHPVTPVLAPFLIAAPVIDCLVLIVRRLRARRSPFSADHDHMHHRLIDLGLTPTAIVALLVGVTLLVGPPRWRAAPTCPSRCSPPSTSALRSPTSSPPAADGARPPAPSLRAPSPSPRRCGRGSASRWNLKSAEGALSSPWGSVGRRPTQGACGACFVGRPPQITTN